MKSDGKPKQHTKDPRHHTVQKDAHGRFHYRCMDDRPELFVRLNEKNWCIWTFVLEKTAQSPLDRKKNKQISKWEYSTIVVVIVVVVAPWKDWSWEKSWNILDISWEYMNHWWRISWWGKQKARGEEDDRGWDGQAALTVAMNINLKGLTEAVLDRRIWGT